mmetsp:Transcript_27947/g.82876  ORF Transcript_27947/g.82876 Transcript_27947/m.82876 type:complete len:294 (+) Transcript_27947:844-1725(+)
MNECVERVDRLHRARAPPRQRGRCRPPSRLQTACQRACGSGTARLAEGPLPPSCLRLGHSRPGRNSGATRLPTARAQLAWPRLRCRPHAYCSGATTPCSTSPPTCTTKWVTRSPPLPLPPPPVPARKTSDDATTPVAIAGEPGDAAANAASSAVSPPTSRYTRCGSSDVVPPPPPSTPPSPPPATLPTCSTYASGAPDPPGGATAPRSPLNVTTPPPLPCVGGCTPPPLPPAGTTDLSAMRDTRSPPPNSTLAVTSPAAVATPPGDADSAADSAASSASLPGSPPPPGVPRSR